jgi:hypothetical protein
VAVGLAGLAAANACSYLVAYPARGPLSFEAAQGRYLATLTALDRVRFVGNSWQPFYPVIGQMLAPNVLASDLLNPARSLPLAGDPSHNLVFVFDNDETRYLPLVQSYYPGGEVGTLSSPAGNAFTYRVPAAHAIGRYGVLLTLEGSAGEALWSGQVPLAGSLPPDLAAAYPLTATWSGAFFLQSGDEPVRPVVQSPVSARLRVQGREVTSGAPLAIEAGWVPFSLQARLTQKPPGDSGLRLWLQRGGAPAVEISRGLFWPQPVNSGLAVTIGGAVTTHRVDPFVGNGVLYGDRPTMNGLLPPPAERDPDLLPLAPHAGGGAKVRWEGEVYAEGGRYEMNLRTDAHALLAIDGAAVLKVCARPTPDDVPIRGGDPGVAARLSMSPGWHRVRLDLDATGDANGLEWSWTRPDGVREIVPPSRLRYFADPNAAGGIAWPDIPGAISCTP